MRDRRVEQARQQVGVLAVCLDAWIKGSDSMDSEVGSILVAETIHMWRASVTKR